MKENTQPRLDDDACLLCGLNHRRKWRTEALDCPSCAFECRRGWLKPLCSKCFRVARRIQKRRRRHWIVPAWLPQFDPDSCSLCTISSSLWAEGFAACSSCNESHPRDKLLPACGNCFNVVRDERRKRTLATRVVSSFFILTIVFAIALACLR